MYMHELLLFATHIQQHDESTCLNQWEKEICPIWDERMSCFKVIMFFHFCCIYPLTKTSPKLKIKKICSRIIIPRWMYHYLLSHFVQHEWQKNGIECCGELKRRRQWAYRTASTEFAVPHLNAQSIKESTILLFSVHIISTFWALFKLQVYESTSICFLLCKTSILT